jgi:hypothetical protein
MSLPAADPLRIFSEYVLRMSITCLGEYDVTPPVEECVQDSRLGDAEREDLTEVYRNLLPRAASTTAAP